MRRIRGKGKLEFVLIVAVFGLLAAVLLNRLIGMEQEAERTEVELTLRNMRVGLQLAIGELIMRGQEERLPELLQANPVGFLGHLPSGYRGETATPGGPGTWRFDPLTRTLAYQPRQPEVFGNKTELEWKLTARGERNRRIVGLGLEAVTN